MNMDESQVDLAGEGDKSLTDAPTKPELDLNQFLPYRLNSLADRISQALAELYQERYQLNIAQWRVLAWLSHCDEMTAKKICAYTNMDKARVSRAIQVLEDRGLVSRTPSPTDQRLQDLHLTPEGQRLLTKLIPEAQAWEAELVATLTAGEYRDLLNVMRKLERQLERIG
ncbi:MarR family winged helix-turn-helix transcriptional regulator [Billgrantia kenyensis]|uniref:Winged helix-turn-helix transcriptional regulator n=1 Tax=Billgrantia kenyensis TaxID=321266 RepID=A0A7W0ACW7_9GAMM|nr:MarR family winged helix-turn-helix transcriptional regulator [Halomonas kenyensis]MBA2777955.1 winged helix-turn-helix transcriptional regulator [Halomonas kenyensis]MCG6661426.1 winged helix-turn-helix transcriptional regulator [Halomonas kenyensis]